jgi:hypothetical protein
MRRMAVVAVALAILAACGGGDDGDEAGDRCAGAGDTISSSRPVVNVRSEREGCSFTVTEPRSVADGSTIKVRRGDEGSGRALLAFADVGVCSLSQLTPAKAAIVITRFPEGALFQQRRGTARCTLQGSAETICPGATFELTGEVTQARITCDPDPVLSIAPYRGDVTVTLRSGAEYALGAGQELNVYPEPTATTPDPEVAAAEFTMVDVRTFQRQAGMMDIGWEPLTPSPTPTPTPTIGAPANTSPPAIDWQTVGETLVVTSYGSWEPPADSYAVTWEAACSPDGSACRATGATGETYSPVYNQDCNFVRAVVTATNAAGSASAASAPVNISCID